MQEIISSGLVEKIYITDTSVWIHHPFCADVLGSKGNLVVVPWAVVEEIDNLKTRQDLKGASAREAARQLKHYRRKSLEQKKSLRDGVSTSTGGWVAVDHYKEDEGIKGLPHDFNPKATGDDQIIMTALQWQTRYPSVPVTIISRDNTLLLKSDIIGLNSEDYEHDTVINSLSDLYSGIIDIPVDHDHADFLNNLYGLKKVSEEKVFECLGKLHLNPNQCCRFLGPDGAVTLAVYKRDKKHFRLVDILGKKRPKGCITPMNDEQAFAFDLLTDPDIYLVTLSGPGGCGKTLISLWAGATQLDDLYQELMVFRPIVEMGGRSLGYLKGTLEEKFQPWTLPIYDNIDLVKMSLTPKAQESIEERLKLAPLIHVRGRSLHDKFIIVDDSQNLTPHEAKTIATRPAGNSKLILCGDPEQIDEPFLTPISNGLVYAIQRMKGSDIFGHITLTQSVRSVLSKVAGERL